MDVELPSDEDILEAMLMDHRPLPELETLQVGYQRNPWSEPSNGLYLENYYAYTARLCGALYILYF
jgi:hypothetical protein